MLNLNILLESFWVASLLPFSHQPTFFAMLGFSGYAMALPLVIAVLGATLGQCFNAALGRGLLILKERGVFVLDSRHYTKAQFYFQKYGVFLLLLSWLPLGNIVPLIAGFLRVPLRIMLPLILLGQAARYGYAML